MACKYELYNNPSASSKGKTRMHPRPLNNGKTSSKDITKRMAKSNTNSESQIKAVLDDFFNYMYEELAEGKSVHIEGLGDFQITLKSDVTIKHPEDVRAGSIKVDSIGFRPQKKVVDRLKNNVRFERTHSANASADSALAILDHVKAYFENPENKDKGITSQFVKLETGLADKTVSHYLHQLAMLGYLKNLSPDVHHPVYMSTEKLWNE